MVPFRYLRSEEGCTEQFIILSNRSGNLQIGQDELKLISNKLDAMECDFFCIGNALDNELVKAGIFDSPQPENHSTGYVYHAYGQKMHGNGFSDSDFYYDDSPQGIYDHLEDMWHFIFSDRYR